MLNGYPQQRENRLNHYRLRGKNAYTAGKIKLQHFVCMLTKPLLMWAFWHLELTKDVDFLS